MPSTRRRRSAASSASADDDAAKEDAPPTPAKKKAPRNKKAASTKKKKAEEVYDEEIAESPSSASVAEFPAKGERKKRSPKKKASKVEDETDASTPAKAKKKSPKKKKAASTKRKKPAEADSDAEEVSDSASFTSIHETTTKAARKTRGPKKNKMSEDEEETTNGLAKESKPKRMKKADHQRLTERDDLPKLWDAEEASEKHGSYTFKIMSWNVAGLRALMRNHPTALSDLAMKHNFDVICLQETKLQDVHVDDPKLKISGHLLEGEGYDSYFSCATAKKGYSGTAAFVKKRVADKASKGSEKKKQAKLGSFFKAKQMKEDGGQNESKTSSEVDISNLIPTEISYKIGKTEHDAEGRIITIDFPLFSLSNVYVPNSGVKLDRLLYRTEQWDTDLLTFMQQKEKNRNVPVIWLGDLNVAHTGMDVWNEGAKHLAKSAGTTPEERASFERQLAKGYVDAFRGLHPNARGQYSYWSQRAGNRPPNKGLRLDYFICSKVLVGADGDVNQKVVVRDCYMIPDQLGSDHCPIVLELEIKK